MSDEETNKPALGVSKLLPPDARKMLIVAAEARSLRAIDSATDYAKACYPKLFQHEGVPSNG